MAEPLVLPKFPALETSPTREALDEGIATFRAEFEHCDDRAKQAVLAHHLAQLLQLRGDQAGAARDELSATNLAPGFAAALETLIRIAAENRSVANLDRLLSRLLSIATTKEERERARLVRTFLLLHQGRLGEALAEADACSVDHPDSPVCALALDLVAAQAQDETERTKATSARTRAARNPKLRALLGERLARHQAASGDGVRALLALRIAMEGAPHLEGLEQWERLERAQGEFRSAADVALRTAEFLEQAPSSSPSRVGAPEAPGAEIAPAPTADGAPNLPPLASRDHLSQAARVRAALQSLEAGEPHEAESQLEILAFDERAGLFEAALLFAFAQARGDEVGALGAAERALGLDVLTPPERGGLHLLAALLAARAGEGAKAKDHRSAVRAWLGVSPTALALQLLDAAEPEAGDPSSNLLGFVRELTETWRRRRDATGSPPAGESLLQQPNQRQDPLAAAALDELLLLQATLQLATGAAETARGTLEQARAEGLAEVMSATLELGIARGRGDRATELSRLARPPGELPPKERQLWLLSGLRLALQLEGALVGDALPAEPGMNDGPERGRRPGPLLDALAHELSAADRSGASASTASPKVQNDLSSAALGSNLGATPSPVIPSPDELEWLRAALRPPGGPPSGYLPERTIELRDPELQRALTLGRVILGSSQTSLTPANAGATATGHALPDDTNQSDVRSLADSVRADSVRADAVRADAGQADAGQADAGRALAETAEELLARRDRDELVLGLLLGARTASGGARKAQLLERVGQQFEGQPFADVARLRAGLLWLSLGLERAVHDPEQRRHHAARATALLEPLVSTPDLAPLAPWLERAAGPGVPSWPRLPASEEDPLVQLESALAELDQGDVATTAPLAFSALAPPRCAGAQLFRLLLALGLSTQDVAEVLDTDPLVEDGLRAELTLAAAFLADGPEEQLARARELLEHDAGIGPLLSLATTARLNRAPEEERAALRTLAEQLGLWELVAAERAATPLARGPAEPNASQQAGAEQGADAEREVVLELLQLASAGGGAAEEPGTRQGRAESSAAVCWELLERLSRRLRQEGPHAELWRDRSQTLLRLAGALTPAEGQATAEDQGAEASPTRAPSAEAALLRLQAGYLALSVGDDQVALETFAGLLEQLPDDEALYLGLRVAAARTQHAELEARASAELARRSPDHRLGAELWERAGVLYHDVLRQPALAEQAFAASLTRLPSSPLAFARLYEIASGSGERDRLVELIDIHLPTVQGRAQRVELLWEKARYCRSLGRPAAAQSALDELLTLAPDHLQALALAAELHLVDRRLEPAAMALRALALHPGVADDQRAEPGLHAADLLESLHRPKEALALLADLAKLGVDDALLVERRARAAALAGQWDVAYQGYRQLAEDRDIISERLHAAKLLLAIVRDHLASADELKEAARLVLRDAPTDEDALGIVLEENFNSEERGRLLRPALEECLADLRRTPLDASRIARLHELTAHGPSPALERLALGLLSLTGALQEAQANRLAELARRAPRRPSAPLSRGDLQAIASPGQLGTFTELGRKVGQCLREAALPNFAAMGMTPSMRIDPFSIPAELEECEALCDALSLGEHELFVGGAFPEALMVLPGEPPTVLLGGDVTFPLPDVARARLCYLVFSHHLGSELFLQMPLIEAENWLAALGRLNSTDISGPGDRGIEEKARTLARLLDRDDSEAIWEMAQQLEQGGMTPHQLVVSARAGAARLATLIHGEPSIIRKLPELIPADEPGRNQLLAEVVRFACSDVFLTLRNKLGLELS